MKNPFKDVIESSKPFDVLEGDSWIYAKHDFYEFQFHENVFTEGYRLKPVASLQSIVESALSLLNTQKSEKEVLSYLVNSLKPQPINIDEWLSLSEEDKTSFLSLLKR